MLVRMRADGAVMSDTEFKRLHDTTSFPETITTEILGLFDADQVQEGPQPTVTENQYVEYVGVENIDGVWTTVYVARDYTPEQLDQRLQQKRAGMVVTPFQGKAALFQAGLLDDVEALIAGDADTLTKLAWANALEWRRLSPMIASLAAALGMTDAQLDALFETARTIEA